MSVFPKLTITAALACLAGLPLPAAAQDTIAECRAQFRAADTNGDGVLDADEIAAAEDIPEELVDREEVTLDEFMAACTQ